MPKLVQKQVAENYDLQKSFVVDGGVYSEADAANLVFWGNLNMSGS